MSRTVTTVWHASLSTLAALVYFLFVLPRWWELTGYTSHVLGTVFRILLGVLIGLIALPVLAALKRARRPEFGTPQLALTLLTGSIVAQLSAGALIAGTAVSEIWLSPERAGVWQFGIYGAAAAIALLGVGAYYLSFIAEMPPPPPKPIKPKVEKQARPRRWSRKKAAAGEDEGDEAEDDGAADADDDDAGADETEDDETEDDETADDGAEDDETEDETVEAEPQFAETVESQDRDYPQLAPTAGSDKLRPSGKRQAKKGE